MPDRAPPSRPFRPLSFVFACAAALLPVAASAGWPEERADELRADAARHEHGEGVARDPARAAALYCEAAKLGDATAQFDLGWMYANGRGVARNDAWAAFFFQAAADHGVEQAVRMLAAVGGPTTEVPDCMKPPPKPAADEAAMPAAAELRIPVAAKAIVEMVRSIAPEYGVEPRLALAIVRAESNFDPQAVSPKNARGLMQLIPETAERFRVKDPFDPKQNLRGGLAYLRWLLAYFEGDLALVAAAYNAGEGAVERHRGVPPYPETRGYVTRVLATVGAFAHPFNARVTAPSPQLRLIQKEKAPPAPAAITGAATSFAPRRGS